VSTLTKRAALPALLDALERATSADGASALDPGVSSSVWRRALVGPAAEILARPGKELRTSIVRAGWTLGGGLPAAMPVDLPLVIELLHAGSLIVDDVEDGSLQRRGAPALHHLVGAPLAINTGSWMYFWALAELGSIGLPADRELAAHRLATSTLVRCHQGQALDLALRIADVNVTEVGSAVAATTRLKTGALCQLAAELGALAAGAAPAVREAVGRFGQEMGVGLQMLDDLGSLACGARRDKAREDLREGRPTWPWAWLAEHSPFAWNRLAAMSRAVVAGTEDVDELADALLVEIEPAGRACVRIQLDTALENLVAVVGDGPVTQMVAGELSRMEASYG
jgi:geranylgeranyl pyrophosphate synthase